VQVNIGEWLQPDQAIARLLSIQVACDEFRHFGFQRFDVVF
jgi:hypothetical protein